MGQDARKLYVIGPDGRRLTLPDLPSPRTSRWVARRKAEVVAAVHGGLLTLEQACTMYALTLDEFLGWESALDRFGMAGLRVTHARDYRHGEGRDSRHHRH